MDPTDLSPWLTLAAAAMAGAAAALFLRARWHRWRLLRRFARGAEGEERALALAAQAGYRVLATQVPSQIQLIVDGRAETVDVRADLLLSRRGRRFIGEVKTGRRATDPKQADTRRQLLEYALAYEVDGVLLFDMEANRIHAVRFAALHGRPERLQRRLVVAALLLAFGAAVSQASDLLQALARG